MRTRSLRGQLGANGALLANAASLVGTIGISSAVGFFYWWLAARIFAPEAVGRASAAISAMTFLGKLGILGLGTLLIGELPHQPGRAGSLVTTSLLVAGLVSAGLGIVFAVVVPFLSADLGMMLRGLGSIALFTLGVVLTAVMLVVDQAVIGLLRGELQLWRNAVFAFAKLLALWMAGVWIGDRTGLPIYATWAVGNLISLVVMAWVAVSKGFRVSVSRPQWALLRGLGRTTLGHHVLNLALEAPNWLLPVIVTVLISSRAGATFYVTWMMASFGFVVPNALATMIYAVGAADSSALADRVRLTLKLSLLAGVLASSAVAIGGSKVLSLFGRVYADQAGSSLLILTLGVFPVIIKAHYVAIARLRRRLAQAALLFIGGSSLELLLAALGARMGGLSWLSLGLVIALCVEAAFTAPVVCRVAFSTDTALGAAGQLE